jgi:hypothetical protein
MGGPVRTIYGGTGKKVDTREACYLLTREACYLLTREACYLITREACYLITREACYLITRMARLQPYYHYECE